jgi:hypothetical protein
MDNFHLLDDGGLATFAGSCGWSAKVCDKMQAWCAKKGERRVEGIADLPKSNILHSFRNLFESSSITLSMAWLFFFCSASSLLELIHPPIIQTGMP